MPEKSVASPTAAAPSPAVTGIVRFALELTVVTAIFAAAGAWPTPDTNEAHYLSKARHAFDPSWGGGDFFLESREAHGVFYRLLGPLAASMPLERAAWIGRFAGWASLAAGFVFLSAVLLPRAGSRIVAAALFSLAARHTPAAGEWVIGGCEAKVFAWALVFVGIGWFVRGRSAVAWAWLGAATALHPLVGGWAMVALLPAAVADIRFLGRHADDRGLSVAVPLLIGVLLAALGVMPALGLSAGVDGAERAKATFTYVVERLPHHLLVRTFADGLVARHLLAVVVWWLLLPLAVGSPARWRMAVYTTAAVGISLAGCAVSLLETQWPDLAHSLLRYYWLGSATGWCPSGWPWQRPRRSKAGSAGRRDAGSGGASSSVCCLSTLPSRAVTGRCLGARGSWPGPTRRCRPPRGARSADGSATTPRPTPVSSRPEARRASTGTPAVAKW
jgi:hypothetical protein